MKYDVILKQLKAANNHLEQQGYQFRLQIEWQNGHTRASIDYGTPEQLAADRIQGRLKTYMTLNEVSFFLDGVSSLLVLMQTYTFINNGMEGSETNADKVKKDIETTKS